MIEILDFTLSVVNTEEDLHAACIVRAQAYGRHVPELSTTMLEPDQIDYKSTVLLVRRKSDYSALGTARLFLNEHEKTQLQTCIILPEQIENSKLVEVTRLAVISGASSQVKLSLMKAAYLFSLANSVDWMVAGARSSALIKQYKLLCFEALFPDYVQLSYAGNLPHQILALNVKTAEQTWTDIKHPLLKFMIGTDHPDILI